MAEKGKAKTNKIKRKAGDDDKHVRTAISRTTVANMQHILTGSGGNPELAVSSDGRHRLREPFRSIVLYGKRPAGIEGRPHPAR